MNMSTKISIFQVILHKEEKLERQKYSSSTYHKEEVWN